MAKWVSNCKSKAAIGKKTGAFQEIKRFYSECPNNEGYLDK